jgi:hemophore
MKLGTVTGRRRVFVGLIAAAVPGAAIAALVMPSATPPATGAGDPCSASEVARTIGSVSKSMGDYLDSHPDTNKAMTGILQQQSGPDSTNGLKSYFQANPKVAADMTSIAQPLTNVSTQCKLPINVPQAMGLVQQTQGGGGLPALPGGGSGLPGMPGATPSATTPVPSPTVTAGPQTPRSNKAG